MLEYPTSFKPCDSFNPRSGLALLALAISAMAGLDSPLGANDVQAGQPHRSGPVNSRRPTVVELETIQVVG